MWQPMTGDLQRFNGAMARQASTWEGLTSTLSDAIKLTSARVFQPLFDVAKSAVGNLNDVLSGDAFSAWAESAGKSIRISCRERAATSATSSLPCRRSGLHSWASPGHRRRLRHDSQ